MYADKTNYLSKFGDANVAESVVGGYTGDIEDLSDATLADFPINNDTPHSVTQHAGDIADLSDTDLANFPLCNNVSSNNMQIAESVLEPPAKSVEMVNVAEPNVSQEVLPTQISSFDRMCLQADAIGKRTDAIKTKCKKFLNKTICNFNTGKNLKYFQKGSMVICGDFIFLVRDKQVMLLKYTGNDSYVVIPDSVGGLPVTLIHETAFNKGRFVTTTKIKNFIQTLRNDNVSLYTLEGMHYAIQGVQKLQLPAELQLLPNYLLKHLPGVRAIEVPEKVSNIAPNAFKKSHVKQIIFSNRCVKNMPYVYLPKDAEVLVKIENVSQYEEAVI